MKILDKGEYAELLEDVCCEYCKPNHYCILKEFLISAHPSPRLIAQLKLIDKYKFEQSKKEDKDIGWNESLDRWVKNGHAKRFADFYDEKIKTGTLYKKIMEASLREEKEAQK